MEGRRLTVLQMLPALASGGVEQGTLEVGRELVRQGHRSLVISTGGRLVEQLEREGSEHIAWQVAKHSHLLPLRYLFRLRDLLRRERVDILHARSRHPAWLAWLAWKGMSPNERPRFITTAHGLYSVNRYSAVMARGERVIAISRTVRDYLTSNYSRIIGPEAIEVIYRGVDPERFRPDFRPSKEWLQRWRQEFPQLVGKPVVTLPGRLSRLKNHADFVEIAARLRQRIPEVQALIVGGEDPRRKGYADEIRALVRDRRLDHVHFTGHRSDMREILALSNVVFSLTSAPPEAFGRTVVEALSLGIPVVGYEQGGTGEILRALFRAGAVPPRDIGAAVETAAGLLGGGEAEIVPNAVFTEARMVSETLSLYRSAAS
jgi:glycosyltransferase involved in cell wall biosynthesis